MQLNNRLVVEAFEKNNGNQNKLHSVLCSIVRVDTTTVNISSLHSRIKSPRQNHIKLTRRNPIIAVLHLEITVSLQQ
jgi:hypothetical protein